MPKVLFLVHGMGDNIPGWSTDVLDQLDATLATYPSFAGQARPFREKIVVEEINYDAVFDKTIEPWGRDRAELEQFARDNRISLDNALTTLSLGQLPEDVSDFVWETLLDPVLYRGSPIVRDNVRQSVTRQFLTAWDKHLTHNPTADQVDVSILCHSQGTIVMSDVLAQVGAAQVGGHPEFLPFSSAKRSISTFMTLANVSRLGPHDLIDIDSRTSCVRPDSAPPFAAGSRNYCRRFINVRHEFDPFCLWQRFEPTMSWGGGYVDVPGVRHVHHANTHGFRHYLLNPRVHIPLFRALLGRDSISPSEENDAIQNFPDIRPTACTAAIETLRMALRDLAHGDFSDVRALDDLILKGMSVYQAAKAALESCRELVGGFDAL